MLKHLPLSRRRGAIGLVTVAALAAGLALPATAYAAGSAPTTGTSLVPARTTVYSAAQSMNVPALWNAGYTGRGVDVALIDTGVTPVPGLDAAGKVFNGPDLSFESQSPALRYKDTYGHGTHMAGIIAGKDPGWTPANAAAVWSGIAPDARLLSVKVGESTGAVDVSQMIAAIYWVVQHRRDNGLNVRVINLSYGTDAGLDFFTKTIGPDPLAHAARVAWDAGIVVVAAAGNTGFGDPLLNNPAANFSILAAGAIDTRGTGDRADDVRADYSTGVPDCYLLFICPATRIANAFAPGSSITSLAVPGSYLDTTYPGARSGSRFFRGTGSSQAAAMLTGAVALLLQQRPTMTPDEVRRLLGYQQGGVGFYTTVGKRVIDIGAAGATPLGAPDLETPPASTGVGLLDTSRGSGRLAYSGVILSGEKDIFGRPVSTTALASAAKTGKVWTGGTFNGVTWAGTTWDGTSFATATWPASWSGKSWSEVVDSTNVWSGGKWSGGKWSGGKWSGGKWSGEGWSSAGWV